MHGAEHSRLNRPSTLRASFVPDLWSIGSPRKDEGAFIPVALEFISLFLADILRVVQTLELSKAKQTMHARRED